MQFLWHGHLGHDRTRAGRPRHSFFLRAELSRNPGAFSVNGPDRLLSIIEQLVDFPVKSRIMPRHIVSVACVFIHIVGSIFIFNISTNRHLVSVLDQRVGAPPRLAWAGIFLAPSTQHLALMRNFTLAPFSIK
jgi:hypothetical protein